MPHVMILKQITNHGNEWLIFLNVTCIPSMKKLYIEFELL